MHKAFYSRKSYGWKCILVLSLFLFTAVGWFSVSGNCRAAASSDTTEADSPLTYQNPETDYQAVLDDEAGLLDEEDSYDLFSEMRKITAYGNVAFKSVSRSGFSTSYFAERYYHERFGSASGTLFLIDMYNREIYIFSDGAIYKTITDSYATTITDNVYRYASNGDYYNCALKAYEQILQLLSGRRIAQPMKYISNALLALILAALINYFIAGALSRTKKASSGDILNAAATGFAYMNPVKNKTRQTRVYRPVKSSSGGGSHGGGGGGHSGGGGGHRF